MPYLPQGTRRFRKAYVAAVILLTTPLACRSQVPGDDLGVFNVARAQVDPARRVQALERFVTTHGSSDHLLTAQKLLLDTYLSSFPDRTNAIHTVASAQLRSSSPDLERWTEEVRLADQLANAGKHGVNLEDAHLWANEAVQAMNEPNYRRQLQHERFRFHLPALSAKLLHEQFLHDRAEAEAALAAVLLQLGHLQQAGDALTETLRLNPRNGEAFRLRAQLELEQNRPAAAILDFIQSDALFPLPARWRTEEIALFRQLDHGNEDALDRRVDEAYRAAHPALFHLTSRSLPAGGHTVLLELFTGSDCAPCAGPDLALDSLLDTYTRTDLVALEFDLHIPQPDPLATPATMEQVAAYRVESTPSAFLDGQPLQILGSSRADVENIVVGFADQIEEEAQSPAPVHLSLASSWESRGHLQASAALGPAPNVSKADLHEVLQRSVLRVALAEDHIRYQGKNGVRFHRFVVRALQQMPAALLLPDSSSQHPFRFDLAAIERRQAEYLAEFEQHNDRFGSFQFQQRDVPIHPDNLAVVAWIQDPVSQQVLQSTFTAVPAR